MKNEKTVSRTFLLLVCFCMLLGIFITRGLTLTHNKMMHPDEFVFYGSTEALMNDLLYDEKYEPLKAYPEGTYVFRLPFQLLAQVVELDENYEANVYLWGRISSVLYYSVGCLLGLWLVVNVLGGGKSGAVIYALAVTFSLFQTEISRYGTFDPVSFMVLMFALVMTAKYLRTDKRAYLVAAVFAIGVAAAGKYSLAYFFVLPAALFILKKEEKKKKLVSFCMMALSALLGFILFSPSVLMNPHFFINTIRGGLSGYVMGGNVEGYSTIPESLFSAVVYQLFYSDLPLALIFAVLGAVRICRGDGNDLEKKFFGRVLPVALLVFLLYNCMLTTFFFRTLFPYYCICTVYAAAGMGRLCRGRKLCAVIVVLCTLMTVRGVYFVSVLSDNDYAARRAEALRADAEAAHVTQVVWLDTFFPGKELRSAFSDFDSVSVGTDKLVLGEFPEIREGQLVLTGSIEHGWAKYCVFAPKAGMVETITREWAAFKEENGRYYIGSLFPQHYYWLFGFWLHGSTATNYEFPNSFFYYRPSA